MGIIQFNKLKEKEYGSIKTNQQLIYKVVELFSKYCDNVTKIYHTFLDEQIMFVILTNDKQLDILWDSELVEVKNHIAFSWAFDIYQSYVFLPEIVAKFEDNNLILDWEKQNDLA